MSMKTIILVILFAALVGVLIVYAPRLINQSKTGTNPLTQTTTSKTPPTLTPIPTPPPPVIGKDTNLKETVGKMSVPDFKADFENLKSELQ